VQRWDGSGHLNPRYARALLDKARETQNEDDSPEAAHSFLKRSRSSEPVAEELGEAFVEAATSGEEAEPARRDRVTLEENGGPFVETRASVEFALGTDESNIAEAFREPLPRTSKAEP
jgi:hypothetical protein